MYMILCVIDDPGKMDDVLAAWKKAGIKGVTILESIGLHRHGAGAQPPVPMRYVFGGSGETERGNFTLFSVVESEAMVQRCLEAAEGVIGSFDQPNTGIFTAWPLAFAKGMSGTGLAGGK